MQSCRWKISISNIALANASSAKRFVIFILVVSSAQRYIQQCCILLYQQHRRRATHRARALPNTQRSHSFSIIIKSDLQRSHTQTQTHIHNFVIKCKTPCIYKCACKNQRLLTPFLGSTACWPPTIRPTLQFA